MRHLVIRLLTAAFVVTVTVALVASAGDDTRLAVFADLSTTFKYPTLRAPAYAAAAAHVPHAVLQIGDWDHRNPKTLAAARRMHREVRTCATVAGCDFATALGSVPLYHVWDDHDYGCDNGDRTCIARATALQAFKEAYPAVYPGEGIWRDVVIGAVHVFLLDLRSQRSRNDTPDGPAKTMLGNAQKAWLFERLAASTSPWKVLASSVVWNPTSGKVVDSWRSFATEREEVLDFITTHGITGVVVVSGDMHSGGGIDDSSCAGLPEMNVPGTNTLTTGLLGQRGCWSHGIRKGNPGYGVIIATPTTLRLETRGAAGELRLSLDLSQ